MTTPQPANEPLTFANAPRQVVNGVEYLTDEASLAVDIEVIAEFKDLFEALEKQ